MNTNDRLTLFTLPFVLLIFWAVARFVLTDWRWIFPSIVLYGLLRLQAHFE